ncbi:beta-galactosidase [Coraliomargarita sp. SDUM461004]|uniref:Beta-galactosidase n=1 Tax=Thalassobacterium sedimentorum TaxID=3041258 RepID=A0ABU1APN2_9BACT|nr:beta-galactosidase [Coraliomargarita sp. SDUM461004]MDQ8196188.1 beta-galactosidase [Coraliomargarita sp. SDUM461004]
MNTKFFIRIPALCLLIAISPLMGAKTSEPLTNITLIEKLEDEEAWVQALSIWISESQDGDVVESWGALKPSLSVEIQRIDHKVGIFSSQTGASGLEQVAQELKEIDAKIEKFCTLHGDSLAQQTKKFFERQNYLFGVSYDRNPTARLAKWALFGQGLFRLNSFWQEGGRDVTRTKETIADTLGQLQLADHWGLQSILIVNLKPLPKGPLDFVFTQDLVPEIRPSFWGYNYNSARLRNELQGAYREWGEATADTSNIAVYQMNNEPFWSTSPNPILGYDPMTIGGDPAVWRQMAEDRYPTREAWLKAFPDRSAKARNKSLLKGKSVESFFDWASLSEAEFDSAGIRGLTFIEFLQERYGSLEKLNLTWYGEEEQSRWYTQWGDVFPPMPDASNESGSNTAKIDASSFDVPAQWIGDLSELPSPAREDVPAWVDWAEFWAWSINDFLVENQNALKSGGAKSPITTNAITGHCINNYLFNAVDTGLVAWATSENLDALGIDFYAMDFLQAYMGLMRGAAGGRDFFIHETSYQDELAGQYVAMYCFVYGAKGCAFWLRGGDHDVPARGSLKMLELSRALDDYDLQFNSKPYSDGIAYWYSLDTLYLSDALAGSPEAYLREVQVATGALTRAQRHYDVYADRQLNTGVPAHVKVLFAPGVIAVDDATLCKVRDWVELGGSLLISSDFARSDRYGRSRPANDLAWLKKNPRVQYFDAQALRSLRNTMANKSEGWPYNWSWESVPTVVSEIDAKLSTSAPKQLRYLNVQGDLSPSQAGMRISEDAAYVFVDPWAKDITIELSGVYESVEELFSKSVPVMKISNGVTRVKITKGPAVLKFERVAE